jgi:hypothetical protein
MRHILMLALISGLMLGFACTGHAKDVLDPKQSVEGDGKDVGEECDPKKQNCDDDGKGGSEGVSGTWHNLDSKQLEQAKAEMQQRRDMTSQEVKDWHESKRLERETIVKNGGDGGKK